MNFPPQNMLAVYWLPSVGIGPSDPPPPVLPGKQTVIVLLTDILNYTRPDGTPQVSVVNLTGASFTASSIFEPPYLTFDQGLLEVLTNGSVQALQQAGIGVVLTIMGGGGPFGWSSIPADQIQNFVNYLNKDILAGYGLNGIDIDDEYAQSGSTLVQTVQAMANTFAPGTIISKALWEDLDVIPQIKDYLTYGGIMYYGNSVTNLEYWYAEYVAAGMQNSQLMIGVNPGPIEQGGSFTSIDTTQELTEWQPANGEKLGMMVWTFSQDIQQFTAFPQNQVSLAFPNSGDHEWQAAIIDAMYASQDV
jgi:hypothetical protein